VKALISTKELTVEAIEQLFSRASHLKRLRGVLSQHEKVLNGDTVVNIFWEASTRTRVSFELAAHRLGAHVVNLNPKDSSVAKGETPEDTIANLRALGCRFFVLRHGTSGEIERIAGKVGRGILLINAGDGINEHPSQALIDAFTIRERKKPIDGLRIALVGDILRSRVAHSTMHLLPKLGAKMLVSGPKELLPSAKDLPNVEVCSKVEQVLEGADVIIALRLQRERSGINFTMAEEEYRRQFGITAKRVEMAKPDVLVMHPGPVMRGVEIDDDVVDSPQSVILRQVENGLFIRMAIFELLRGDFG